MPIAQDDVFETAIRDTSSEFAVSTTRAGSLVHGPVTRLSDGSFATVWGGQGGVGLAVFDEAGTFITDERILDSGDFDQFFTPVIEALDNGRFVVAWNPRENGAGGQGVLARIYEQDGTPVGDTIVLTDETTGNDEEGFRTRATARGMNRARRLPGPRRQTPHGGNRGIRAWCFYGESRLPCVIGRMRGACFLLQHLGWVPISSYRISLIS